MRRALILIALTALPLAAQEPQPFARTRLEPGPRVTVGQPVTVVVEVLVPKWFTGAPRFPSLDVADAIAVYEDRGTNFTEKIDGQTWAGQSRSYHVYPQRPGSFEVAAIPVQVRYMSDSGGPRTRATVSPPAIRFEAVVPPEAQGLPYFLSTTGLAVEQSFDREPATLERPLGGTEGGLRVGEAFTRTITVTVEGALAMVIPPLPSDPPAAGLAVYPDPPRVTDAGGERGEPIVGTRIERATYVAEEAGDYRLPPIELAWWDVDAERLRTTSLPALTVHVEPNPDLVAEIPLPPDEAVEEADAGARRRVSVVELLRRWGVPLAAAALVLVLFSLLWRRYAPSLRRRLADARRRRRESEAAAFARFRRAARAGDPRATWSRWTSWLDRTHRGPGAATVRAFVNAAGDPGLERESTTLDAMLFAEGDAEGHWSPKALYRRVAAARRRRGRAGRAEEASTTLNPRREGG